ncbi:MAG: ATP-dependent helicase [Saprospiraceae bacterium]|nr:ATP-dependent helicase [Saprospiraceae bacterium]
MNKIKQEYQASWQKAYENLNQQQRLAVDTIEGPVMTVAGPGTGKTQLLTVRIGNILLKTDAQPHNILCLTYTDAGVIAMRQRLSTFIGAEAYNVNISTFHSFCSNVIRENLQYFGDLRALQLVSDVEEAEVFRDLIDTFDDDHPLKRYKSDEYYEVRRLKKLFINMKQEKWTYESIKEAFDKFAAVALDPDSSPYIWGKSGVDKEGNKYKKGDFNKYKAEENIEKLIKGVAAAKELDQYNKLMLARERYDYHDMILWVIDKFNKHDELLGKYQERYQYILVDEYQDTNGSQNELLFKLAEYWDDPNLFIVGDDDQSIFRFQGANMDSIIDFKKKYDPVEIVLNENYRSSQKILDCAKTLIENNEDRLVRKFPHIVKDLKESRQPKPVDSPEPEIIEYLNEAQEEAGIIQKIMELHEKGVLYKEMAVIYTKHKTVENMVRYFSQKKVPINVKKRVNILYENEVIQLTNILEYLEGEYTRMHSNEDMLFEILHYNFLGLSALDIASISLFCNRKSENDITDKKMYPKWREVISDSEKLRQAGVRNIDSVLRVSGIIEDWIKAIANVTIQTLIEKILTEGNMLQTLLKDPDKSWKLLMVNTYFDFIKEEASKVKLFSLKQANSLIKLMKDSNIELPVYRIISNENGINFMTAYGSKGLEFEHVFMIRCTKKMWEGKAGQNDNYTLPPNLGEAVSIGNDEEDDRRLFYVAMTRAKEYLYISYPGAENSEKKTEPSKMIAEIKKSDVDILKVSLPEEDILAYKAELMKYKVGVPKLIDDEWVDNILKDYKVSATSLNKYLKCKLTFYFENILGVPKGRSASMGFGSAIHYALEHFFRDIEAAVPRSLGSFSKLSDFFIKGMDKYNSHFTTKEYENYSTHGNNILKEYYEEYSSTWLVPKKYEIEQEIKFTEYQGVPISGKLDRINFFDDHSVTVTDYKTGRYDSSKLKPPAGGDDDLGGDYWRQMVFYKLLLDGDKSHNWVMNKGIMEFLEKDKASGKYKNKEYAIAPFEIEIVGKQLVETYEGIKNHIFTPGCEDEKCQWCNFVMRNMPLKNIVSTGSDDEDTIQEFVVSVSEI